MNLKFEYRRYHLPFRVPIRTARGQWLVREGFILRLESEDGLVGWGEIAPITDFGSESLEAAQSACVSLGTFVSVEALEGIDPNLVCLRSGFRAAVQEIYRLKAVAKSEINTAKLTQIPESLSVAALLPAAVPALGIAPFKVEQGFRTFKWKVGVLNPLDEIAILDDLLAVLPTGSRLRLDANGAWDQRTLERWLKVCADRPIEFIEQPLEKNYRGMQDILLNIQNDYPTAIALDESLCHAHDVSFWSNLGWKGVYVIKPSLFADPYHVVDQLSHLNARVVFSSVLETAVGARTALHLAFRWAGEPLALGFGVWPLFEDALFDGPIAYPFLMRKDVERINPEALWTALN